MPRLDIDAAARSLTSALVNVAATRRLAAACGCCDAMAAVCKQKRCEGKLARASYEATRVMSEATKHVDILTRQTVAYARQIDESPTR